MDLNLISYNGHFINDGETYVTRVLPESRFDLTSQPVTADRAENFPYLSGMVLPAHPFTFEITVKSTDEAVQDSDREQLKAWFSILDFTPHALIAEDRNDINRRQYQLIGTVARAVMDSGEGKGYVTFLITIATMEPLWSAVTATSDTWNITGTAQTHAITTGGRDVAGKEFVRPKFVIQPTTPRTGQFAYSHWIPIYNRSLNPLINYPLDLTNGGTNTANLVNATAVSNQINLIGGITAVAVTIPIDTPVGGGLPSIGYGYVGTEQISWTGLSAGNLTGVTRGLGGTTAAVHADNAVIAQSKMLANGSDLAVQFDGSLINLWVDSPNSASTKVWIAQNWQVGKAGTLLTALPNNATAVTVAFTKNPVNLACLNALKTARNNVFLIDNEAFTYSPGNIDLVNYQITACARAQKFTATAVHAVAAAITWIEHDIWVLYGNSAGSPFTVDDTQKPLLNLNTATNTSWTFSNFFDTDSVRPAAWLGTVAVSTGQQSLVYTGNQTALANPSTELGMSILDYVQASIWKAETANIEWSFYQPAGITTVSIAGSKRLISGTAWPTVAGLQRSKDGTTWVTVWTEAKPALNTWVAWTHNAQALGATYSNIRLAIIGSIAAGVSNEADFQGDTITLALDNTKTPSVAFNAENSVYYLNLKLTNTTTGDYVVLAWPMTLAHTLTVDTNKKTITYDDGSNAISALTLSNTRNDWLPLRAGDNTLQVDDTGIANVTITTTYTDRSW